MFYQNMEVVKPLKHHTNRGGKLEVYMYRWEKRGEYVVIAIDRTKQQSKTIIHDYNKDMADYAYHQIVKANQFYA